MDADRLYQPADLPDLQNFLIEWKSKVRMSSQRATEPRKSTEYNNKTSKLCFAAHGLECPLRCDAQNILYWFDAFKHPLHWVNTITRDYHSIETPDYVGAIVPRKHPNIKPSRLNKKGTLLRCRRLIEVYVGLHRSMGEAITVDGLLTHVRNIRMAC